MENFPIFAGVGSNPRGASGISRLSVLLGVSVSTVTGRYLASAEPPEEGRRSQSWRNSRSSVHDASVGPDVLFGCQNIGTRRCWRFVFENLSCSPDPPAVVFPCQDVLKITLDLLLQCVVLCAVVSQPLLPCFGKTEVIQKLHIITDEQYIPDLNREIVSMHQWSNPGLKAIVQFTWAITLRTMSQYPNVQGEMSVLLSLVVWKKKPTKQNKSLNGSQNTRLIWARCIFSSSFSRKQNVKDSVCNLYNEMFQEYQSTVNRMREFSTMRLTKTCSLQCGSTS